MLSQDKCDCIKQLFAVALVLLFLIVYMTIYDKNKNNIKKNI